MDFYYADNAVFSWVSAPEHLCGWNNLLHGGVIATILDEIMSWTAIDILKKLYPHQKNDRGIYQTADRRDETDCQGHGL
jgi:hypothetical protein